MSHTEDELESPQDSPVVEELDSREATASDKLTKKIEGAYDASSITVLEGLEAVRRRPGMYVGDNGKKGLHQMFREALDNGVDEAMAGHCDRIEVVLYKDGSISVEDNGRGIPVDIHKKEKVSALQVIMTKLHAGGKFGEGGGYKVSGGLHGVGISCTNALSEWMETTVSRDGKMYRQRYEAGVPVSEVEVVGKSNATGTKQHWKPDPTALTVTEHDPVILRRRMKELAYLNPSVTFDYKDEIHPELSESYFFEKGIVQLVEDISESETVLHKPIYFHRVREDMEIEVAILYNTGFHNNYLAYCNNIHQPDGGTHVSGFSQAITRVINSYARKMNLLKEKDKNFSSDDVSEGLFAVISLKIQNPSYNSQDKVKLVTPEVQGATNSLVGDGFSTYLEENPAVARRIVEKAVTAQRAREAARKAAEAVKRSSAMDSFGLPGKLSDCVSNDPSQCELFIVEGDSAGGTVKQARDRMTQALLPLRGKILNVERARIDKALDNEEIKSLIAALGAGVDIHTSRHQELVEQSEGEQPAQSNGKGEHFDIKKLRYDKVIIMTDADVDGEHIRTLILTFFYRYMKPIITEGHLYFAQPPLFVIRAGKDERFYAMDEAERDRIVKDIKRKNYSVSRFKGLGEMNPEELEETTMNPESRHLVQVHYDKEFDAEVEMMFSRLMGDKVEPRREFIMQHAREAEDLDWHY
ncbi:DNA gyrase subunit B [Kamptonema cortianum]|nr:DNA gyrase subunit B [Geitlerinema splendidum]MDK3157593.1 DNA gyrase subunit B [Kamptonema cortianum]